MHAAVYQSDSDIAFVELAKLQRREHAGHTGRCGGRLADANVAVRSGRFVFEIHTTQSVIAVDFAVDQGRRLAHPARRELPVVAGVQTGGVQDQDRHLVLTLPVVVFRIASLVALRLDDELAQDALFVVGNACIEMLFVQLREPATGGVAGLKHHAQVRPQIRAYACAEVVLHAGQEVVCDALDQFHIVVGRQLPVGLILQQLAYLKIVMRTDDGAARHARQHLDMAQ